MFFARLCVLLLRGNFLSTSSHFQRQTNSLLVVEYNIILEMIFLGYDIVEQSMCGECEHIY